MNTLEFEVINNNEKLIVLSWDQDTLRTLVPIKYEGAWLRLLDDGYINPDSFEFDTDEELDAYILPLKDKYDQVIQILPNGERRVI